MNWKLAGAWTSWAHSRAACKGLNDRATMSPIEDKVSVWCPTRWRACDSRPRPQQANTRGDIHVQFQDPLCAQIVTKHLAASSVNLRGEHIRGAEAGPEDAKVIEQVAADTH